MQAVDPSTTIDVPTMEGKRNDLALVALLGAVAVLILCYWYFSKLKSKNQERHAVCSLTEKERRTLAAKRLMNLEHNLKEDDVLPSKKHSEDLKKRNPRQRVVSEKIAVSSSGGSITAKKEKMKCAQQLNEAETVRQPITGVAANPHENVPAQVRPSELVHKTTSSPTEQRPVSITPSKRNARCLVEQLMESENDQEAIQVVVSSQRQGDHTVGELVPLEASPSAETRTVSWDNKESEISSNESIQDPPPQNMKPKRKKILLSPPQVICEALSHVFKCRVTAEPKGDAGTWGGEGWIKRRSEYPNAITITLPLYKLRPPSMENEWTALCVAFPKVLDSSSLSPKLLQNNIRKVIVCHSRANDMARKGFTLVMKGDEGGSEIRSCMEALSHWLAKQVAFLIRPEEEAARSAIHDEDEVSDLFRNDYNTDETQNSGSCHTGPFESIFDLLEETECVVTGEFMEDLFCVYTEKSTLDDQHLPQVFLSQILSRLVTAKQSNSFSSPTLTNRIMAISNLLTMSSSVGQALVSSMRGELEQMKSNNGRDIQALVRLAPLIEAVAYSVPAAGTERQPGPRKGGFLQQLESVQDFPACVFLPKRGDETGRVMEEARRTMKAARQSAELSLRVVFRIGGKEQTFQWLANIIRSK
jgi:hypothetical protein